MNKKNKIQLIVLGLIIIFCLWAFISAGYITQKFKKEIKDSTFENQKVTIDGLLLTETKEGKKQWEMYAETGYYESAIKIIYITDVIGNVFDKDKSVIASFKSNQATYNDEKKEIIMSDKANIIYKDGSNISAERIIWKGNNEDIVAQGNVRIEKPNE